MPHRPRASRPYSGCGDCGSLIVMAAADSLDLAALYRQMVRIRRFEEVLERLWQEGLISGEMHLAIGEEGVHAGVCAHLRDGDAVAVDHRSTPPFVARGVGLLELLLEVLGSEEGLNGGCGGHMHLFAPSRLVASSGIVGASAPLATGFALAAQHLRPGSVSVAFFGEGAANQGMLLEALNLAVAWNLPVLFVCKDNLWSVTTRTAAVTGGDLVQRAAVFGMPAQRLDGVQVETVWHAADDAVARARRGEGPSFLLCRVPRPYGHLLGDPLMRMAEHPLRESAQVLPSLARALLKGDGAPLSQRLSSISAVAEPTSAARRARHWGQSDPLLIAARKLPPSVVNAADEAAAGEVATAVAAARSTLEGADA